MSQIVDLKIKLDILRTELDDELTQGTSVSRVQKIHASIKKIEQIMAYWQVVPRLKN
jgi:hypothetical protein